MAQDIQELTKCIERVLAHHSIDIALKEVSIYSSKYYFGPKYINDVQSLE